MFIFDTSTWLLKLLQDILVDLQPLLLLCFTLPVMYLGSYDPHIGIIVSDFNGTKVCTGGFNVFQPCGTLISIPFLRVNWELRLHLRLFWSGDPPPRDS